MNPSEGIIDLVSSQQAEALLPALGYCGHMVTVLGRIARNPLPAFSHCHSLHEIALGSTPLAPDKQWSRLVAAGVAMMAQMASGELTPCRRWWWAIDALPALLTRVKQEGQGEKYLVVELIPAQRWHKEARHGGPPIQVCRRPAQCRLTPCRGHGGECRVRRTLSGKAQPARLHGIETGGGTSSWLAPSPSARAWKLAPGIPEIGGIVGVHGDAEPLLQQPQHIVVGHLVKHPEPHVGEGRR